MFSHSHHTINVSDLEGYKNIRLLPVTFTKNILCFYNIEHYIELKACHPAGGSAFLTRRLRESSGGWTTTICLTRNHSLVGLIWCCC